MRSTFAGLNTMVMGININQLSENTVGHNISNANTEGYSRQKVNAAAVRAQKESSIYGQVMVGRGVDSMSLTRARDIYADRQYWNENSTSEYQISRQKEYDKIEAVFNDTTNEGVQSGIQDFYKAWSALSTSASDSSARITVVEKAKVLADRIHTAAQQMQNQIDMNYADMKLNLTKINDYTDQMVSLNYQIMANEATGAMANDLRDQRDLLVDELSGYINLNVYENEKGMYTIVSDGISLVNGLNKLTLEMSDPLADVDAQGNTTNEKSKFNNGVEYGVNDYKIMIKESGIEFTTTNGKIKAQKDQIREDKNYIDYLANMSGFLLTTFNEQHQAGAGIDSAVTTATYNGTAMTHTGSSGVNFYGKDEVLYSWNVATSTTPARIKADAYSSRNDWHLNITGSTLNTDGTYSVKTQVDTGTSTATTSYLTGIDIIETLNVNAELTKENGQNLVAARTFGVIMDSNGNPTTDYEVNGTGDGTNATDLSALCNMQADKTKLYTSGTNPAVDDRAIGSISLEAYYNQRMTALGSAAETMDSKVEAQDEVMVQVQEWRQSTAGVNWNEELTNMIMFQQGYSACSRCLTTMDEMLDRLINSTGVVGR